MHLGIAEEGQFRATRGISQDHGNVGRSPVVSCRWWLLLDKGPNPPKEGGMGHPHTNFLLWGFAGWANRPSLQRKPGSYTGQDNIIDDAAGHFLFPRWAMLMRQ